jgi:dihydropteroate synthase
MSDYLGYNSSLICNDFKYSMKLDCAGKILDLCSTQVMGVVNVTPDSFSDGGQFNATESALNHARRMVEEGVSIIDVGGESTRPGAAAVTVQQELDRVIPVIEAIVSELDIPLSVDTSKPVVMAEAVAAGAGMINDVYALRQPDALEMTAKLGVPVCMMHMQGEPRTMQERPEYQDVLQDVIDFLDMRIEAAVEAGIVRERILLDPGFGFGKTLQHNLLLLKQLERFRQLNVPLLVGMSRKTMIGLVLDAPVDERLYGSVAVATLAAWLGARVIRVHDVRATVDAIRMVMAVQQA